MRAKIWTSVPCPGPRQDSRSSRTQGLNLSDTPIPDIGSLSTLSNLETLVIGARPLPVWLSWHPSPAQAPRRSTVADWSLWRDFSGHQIGGTRSLLPIDDVSPLVSIPALKVLHLAGQVDAQFCATSITWSSWTCRTHELRVSRNQGACQARGTDSQGTHAQRRVLA